MQLLIIIFVVTTLGWAAYGYSKGAPHGLGSEGIKAAMTGIFGMRKLNEKIAAKQAADAQVARDDTESGGGGG